MILESVAQYMAMGGYGLYVWGSVAATVALLGGELLTARARRKAAIRRVICLNRNRRPSANESTP